MCQEYQNPRNLPHLGNVAKVRMPVTQVFDLSIGQSIEAMISLAEFSLPVFPFAVCNTRKCEHKNSDLSTKIDCVPRGVSWRIFHCICPTIVSFPYCTRISSTHHVARTPPAVPRVTMYALDTARTAGPAALFIPHERKPGPPGKAPSVMKNTPIYRMLGSVAHRRIAKPVMARLVNAAR